MSDRNSPLRRGVRYLSVLQGHAFDGLRLKQIAEAMQINPSMAHRDLTDLADEGMVERIPGREDCWRLSPKPIQLARAHAEEVSRLRAHVDQFDQRYGRTL